MTAWGFRSKGYQLGIMLLYIFSTLFLIGMVAPAWLIYDREIVAIRNIKIFAGIVVGCRFQRSLVGAQPFEYTRCGFGFQYAFDGKPGIGGWVHAVEAFEIISFILLLITCIYAGTVNWFSIYPPKWNRLIEALTAVAGLLGFTFCMVFVGLLRSPVERDVFYFFSWSYYLSVVSSIALIVTAVVIALFNEYIPPPPKSSGNQGSVNVSYSNVSAASSKPAYLGGPPYGGAVSYNRRQDDLYDPRIVQAGYDQRGHHNNESDL